MNGVHTTVCQYKAVASDRENRQFMTGRSDQLWVADFTYGAS